MMTAPLTPQGISAILDDPQAIGNPPLTSEEREAADKVSLSNRWILPAAFALWVVTSIIFLASL